MVVVYRNKPNFKGLDEYLMRVEDSEGRQTFKTTADIREAFLFPSVAADSQSEIPIKSIDDAHFDGEYQMVEVSFEIRIVPVDGSKSSQS